MQLFFLKYSIVPLGNVDIFTKKQIHKIENHNSEYKIGGCKMNEKCFYCDYDVADNQIHVVSFVKSGVEQEESLCNECYQEWLQGIKG